MVDKIEQIKAGLYEAFSELDQEDAKQEVVGQLVAMAIGVLTWHQPTVAFLEFFEDRLKEVDDGIENLANEVVS